MNPTAEQQQCLDLFKTGEHMAIEAGAGTGKTSTLIMLAESTRGRGQYTAFNKAIVLDAGNKMPPNVSANTMHSLAFRAIGRRYAKRLNGARMNSNELAFRLKTKNISLKCGEQPKLLSAQFLASLVMKAATSFCQTADLEPSERNFAYIEGIDMPDSEGKRTYYNNNIVRGELMPALKAAWKDLSDPDGQLRFSHDVYLKVWELNEPRIFADFIAFDEAQDADPVQLSIIDQQRCQKVYVGDSQQSIYQWRGAINALESISAQHRPFLTQSFRFGDEIAEVANEILGWIGAPLRLKGLPGKEGHVGPFDHDFIPDAILCRTNAAAIFNVVKLQNDGVPVHLLGGADEMLRFVRGADDLQNSRFTSHPDLTCFANWGAVQDYVENDPNGSDLALNVKLVDTFGTDVIKAALDNTIDEAHARVTVSTAHKAKGRQWPAVKIHNDFAPKDPEKKASDLSAADQRLMYVAVTRAQTQLDWTAIQSPIEVAG